MESYREEIAKIIREVDQSLIALKAARENGYTLFDFAKAIDRLHQLIFWEKTKEYNDQLSKYFSVFNDLNREASTKTFTYYRLDPSGIRVYEVERKIEGISTVIQLQETHSVKDRWLDSFLSKIGDKFFLKEKKLFLLLEGSDLRYEDQDASTFENYGKWLADFFKEIQKPYVRYSFDIIRIDLSVSFEGYVSSVESTLTRVEPAIFSSLFSSIEEENFTLMAMRDLKITDQNDKFALSDNQKSYLLAFIDVFTEEKIIKQASIPKLTKAFCERIGMKYTKIEKSKILYPKAIAEIHLYLEEKL